MAVVRTCEPGQDKLAVELSLTAKEHLLYEVSFKGAQAIFTIVDQHGTIIMSDADSPIAPGQYRRVWPGGDAVKVPDDLNHVLGVQFVAAVEYTYRVTRCAADGLPLSVRKNCIYRSSNPMDRFFDPLRIFTT